MHTLLRTMSAVAVAVVGLSIAAPGHAAGGPGTIGATVGHRAVDSGPGNISFTQTPHLKTPHLTVTASGRHLTVIITPAAHQTLRLERKVAAGWKVVDSSTVPHFDSNHARYRATVKKPGIYRFVSLKTKTLNQKISKTVTVK